MAAALKFLGITEEITSCDCCGKSELKCTVAMETEEGEVVHYGRTCASRRSGRKVGDMVNAQKAADVEIREQIRRRIERTPEAEALKAKTILRSATYKGGPGRAARDFLQPELDAFRALEIAAWAAAPVTRY